MSALLSAAMQVIKRRINLCKWWIALSPKRTVLVLAQSLCRYAFVALGASFIAGSCVLYMVHAQQLLPPRTSAERLAITEFSLAQQTAEIVALKGQVLLLGEKVDTMEGVGIGLGATAIVIQIIQAVVSRNLGKSSSSS